MPNSDALDGLGSSLGGLSSLGGGGGYSASSSAAASISQNVNNATTFNFDSPGASFGGSSASGTANAQPVSSIVQPPLSSVPLPASYSSGTGNLAATAGTTVSSGLLDSKTLLYVGIGLAVAAVAAVIFINR